MHSLLSASSHLKLLSSFPICFLNLKQNPRFPIESHYPDPSKWFVAGHWSANSSLKMILCVSRRFNVSDGFYVLWYDEMMVLMSITAPVGRPPPWPLINLNLCVHLEKRFCPLYSEKSSRNARLRLYSLWQLNRDASYSQWAYYILMKTLREVAIGWLTVF